MQAGVKKNNGANNQYSKIIGMTTKKKEITIVQGKKGRGALSVPPG